MHASCTFHRTGCYCSGACPRCDRAMAERSAAVRRSRSASTARLMAERPRSTF